jgi:phosphogluconate dehydratase
MPSGIPNNVKAEMRQRFAAGEIDKDELLKTEMKSYHSPGTCTFYGTANTNQVALEGLGVQLAGTSFINPQTKLRTALTEESVKRVLNLTDKGEQYTPLADVITENSIVNAIVLMMATGGSTNLSLHLIAMAAAAGIRINWTDMDRISQITPLLARVYPNGQADVNHFEQAGGLAYLVGQLRSASLLNEDVINVMGKGLDSYVCKPNLNQDKLIWANPVTLSLDDQILSSIDNPFSAEGGMRVVRGDLGTGIVKVSAVDPEHHVIEAPCKIFSAQDELRIAFENGELDCDHVAVVRFQGPAANGMPELHKLTPFLAIAQGKGFKVALVTDGRMSGASGKILAAIHVSPEAKLDGLLAYLQEGDIIRVDAKNGELSAKLSERELRRREPAKPPADNPTIGRGLFANMRNAVGISTEGASFLQNEVEYK